MWMIESSLFCVFVATYHILLDTVKAVWMIRLVRNEMYWHLQIKSYIALNNYFDMDHIKTAAA